jgi:hypothetical protein
MDETERTGEVGKSEDEIVGGQSSTEREQGELKEAEEERGRSRGRKHTFGSWLVYTSPTDILASYPLSPIPAECAVSN